VIIELLRVQHLTYEHMVTSIASI